MIRRHGWLLLSAMVGFSIGISSARAEDPAAKSPKPTQNPPASSAPVHEKKAGEKPTGKQVSPDAEPVFIPGTACRDGNCATRPQPVACPSRPKQEHPPFGAYLDRLGKWFFYRNSPTPCECCGHLPSYRPPLTAWFPCKPGQCSTTSSSVYEEAIIVKPRPDMPPPLPITPQWTQEERPLIPGSSAAMSVKQPSMKKPSPATEKTNEGSGSINFRRSGSPTPGILPIESRSVETRWEKAQK